METTQAPRWVVNKCCYIYIVYITMLYKHYVIQNIVFHPRCSLSLVLSLSFSPFWECSLWGKRVPCCENIQEAYGEAHVVRNWSLLPTTMWMGLEADPSDLVGRWMRASLATAGLHPHERSWARTTQLSWSPISDSQKLRDNKCVLF